MTRVFFHVEVETDVLLDEVENPPAEAQLEAEAVSFVSSLFGRPVTKHGRRHDGALICSFTTDDPERVRQIIEDNGIAEGNDQITSGVEYVIVRDFEFE